MQNPKPVEKPILPIDGSKDSLFVACASYEERSALSATRLSQEYRSERALIFASIEYRHVGNTPRYLNEITSIMKARCEEGPAHVPFHTHDAIECLRVFRDTLQGSRLKDSFRAVTFDITTFPREQLLVLLRFIDAHPQRGKIRLLYGEPKRYATEEQAQEDRWLTRGVRSVQSVPGFGGVQFPKLQKLLAVILGHEGERAHITVRRHQPDKLILIRQGRDQHHDGLREIAEQENEQIISIYGSESFWEANLPSRGVIETEQIVDQIYNKYRYTHNVFIAANGTKLQLIGVYLACRRLQEIQITYAVPSIYNWKRYSTGTSRLSEMILEPFESEEHSISNA